MTQRTPTGKTQALFTAPVLALLAGAIAITIAEGTPTKLPSAALGSTILLHAYRAGILFAIGIAIATVIARARTGRLPTQMTTQGITYGPEESAFGLLELQQQVDDLASDVDAQATQLANLARKP